MFRERVPVSYDGHFWSFEKLEGKFHLKYQLPTELTTVKLTSCSGFTFNGTFHAVIWQCLWHSKFHNVPTWRGCLILAKLLSLVSRSISRNQISVGWAKCSFSFYLNKNGGRFYCRAALTHWFPLQRECSVSASSRLLPQPHSRSQLESPLWQPQKYLE